jgi:protein-tyrosine-phosphatase
MRVLFVCSGNVCRSPFAEVGLRRELAAAGHRGIAVSSAGTLGLRDRPPSRHAVQVARERGLDVSQHRSRPLHRGALRMADLVIVMELAHRQMIEDRWPEEAGKVRLLREYESPDGMAPARDLFDPIGRPIEDYRTCAAVMERCVRNLARQLGAAS